MSILAMIMISEASLNTLIVAVSAVITSIAGSITAIVVSRRGNARVEEKVVTLASSLVDEDGKQKIDKVQERVATLATNIDGAMTELKDSIKARGEAEGQLKGAKDEQERTALIVEPAKITEAMNGAEVREQINVIEKAATEGAATSLRNEEAALKLTEHTAAAQARADKVVSTEPGAAADEAARSPKEE